MNNYFRITGYDPKHDFSFILDCHGMFGKKWQFSSYLVQRGLKVLEITDGDALSDKDLSKVAQDKEHLFLRASGHGKPQYTTRVFDGKQYNEILVGDKTYLLKDYSKL